MNNTTTHYQTSFKVDDSGGEAFIRLKAAVYGWVLKKEGDRVLREKKSDFFFRCHWPELFQTSSAITADSYLNDEEGNAWAVLFTEVDRQHGRARFWHSEIGLKQTAGVVVVSVRISFAWNTEYLNNEPEPPRPSVPTVIRYMLDGNKVFSGRPEFQLKDKPIRFSKVGEGEALCMFIQSPERRYPLIVFNGDSAAQVREAEQLAFELTGKCQVVVIAENEELSQEIEHFLPQDFWVWSDRMRVYFPFNTRRNTPDRHRWYNLHRPDYSQQREGMIIGLLRHNNLVEAGAVETVEDIQRLVSREKLLRLKSSSSPEHKKELEEFYALLEAVENERDQLRKDATAFAAEADQHEAEATRLRFESDTFKSKVKELSEGGATLQISTLIPSLPVNILDVAKTAQRCFPRLVITRQALEAAEDYPECKSLNEAWEILRHLNEAMYRLKFEKGEKDLEKTFQNETGYEVAMTEGSNTKKDKKLMELRKLRHDGREFNITPHVKHGNQEPKLVRIYFDFDETSKKIVVGHIGRHIPNYTTKTM